MLAEHTVGDRRWPAPSGRPVSWVETRSENLVSMPHGRGQVAYSSSASPRDGTDHRPAGPGRRRRRRLRRLRRRARARPDLHDEPGRLRHPQARLRRARWRSPTPRRWAPSAAPAGRRPTAHLERMHRHRRRRARHRPGRAAAAQLPRPRRRSRSRRSRRPLRHRRLRPAAARGAADRRLRRAARGAGAPAARRATRCSSGIGLSVYVEITAGGGGSEYGAVTVHADGSATISAGTSAHGQGHATAFAMLVARPPRHPVRQDPLRAVRHRDSCRAARAPAGRGRCRWAAPRCYVAADDVLEQARRRAAELLEAAVDDVALTDDGGVRGGAACRGRRVERGRRSRAAARSSHAGLWTPTRTGATFPFGAHVSVVEVDTETGRVTPLRHVAVDDCGRILNPLLVAGQQHGGLAQGVAQALYEEILYDADGHPLTPRSPTTACRPRPSSSGSSRTTPRRPRR